MPISSPALIDTLLTYKLNSIEEKALQDKDSRENRAVKYLYNYSFHVDDRGRIDSADLVSVIENCDAKLKPLVEELIKHKNFANFISMQINLFEMESLIHESLAQDPLLGENPYQRKHLTSKLYRHFTTAELTPLERRSLITKLSNFKQFYTNTSALKMLSNYQATVLMPPLAQHSPVDDPLINESRALQYLKEHVEKMPLANPEVLHQSCLDLFNDYDYLKKIAAVNPIIQRGIEDYEDALVNDIQAQYFKLTGHSFDEKSIDKEDRATSLKNENEANKLSLRTYLRLVAANKNILSDLYHQLIEFSRYPSIAERKIAEKEFIAQNKQLLALSTSSNPNLNLQQIHDRLLIIQNSLERLKHNNQSFPQAKKAQYEQLTQLQRILNDPTIKDHSTRFKMSAQLIDKAAPIFHADPQASFGRRILDKVKHLLFRVGFKRIYDQRFHNQALFANIKKDLSQADTTSPSLIKDQAKKNPQKK